MTEIKRELADWLDDLCVRFIINLPKEELLQVERICFQVEEAQWYYEDFIRPLDPDLPSLTLKAFCLRIFQHCPLLSQYSSHHHMTAFEEFLAYKTRVPVRGAILLNHELDSVVLVRGWKKGASWSFPRGKINKDEPDIDCAIREVWEETGYDVREAGLVPKDEDAKFIEMSIRDQHIRLYVFRDVPMDIHFEPRTRKEIGKILWYKLSELPTQKKGKNRQQEGGPADLANHANKFYMVAPFISGLKKWINQQKRISKQTETPKQIAVRESGIELAVLAADQTKGVQTDPGVNGAVLNSNEMGILLASLQQPGQQRKALKSPEPSEAIPASVNTAKESAAVFQDRVQHWESASEATISKGGITGVIEREQKAQSLLALLQGKASAKATELPQTPAEQVIEHPQMPPSPKYHHIKPEQRVQTKRPSPSPYGPEPRVNIIQVQDIDHLEAQRRERQANILNALHYNAPISTNEIGHTNQESAIQPQISSPNSHFPMVAYQRTSNPTYVHSEQTSGFAAAIPAASALPPPKLTAHSSKLLDLFKSNKPIQAALEATPVQADTSHLEVASGLRKDRFIAAEQASLEVSEIEDHHVDRLRQSHREPSEVSFEMPADVDATVSLPDLTPPRPQLVRKQSPRETLAAWQKFETTDARQQADQRRQAAAREAEEAKAGVHHQPEQPAFQETWKKVNVSRDKNERKVVGVFQDDLRSRNTGDQLQNFVTPSHGNEALPRDGITSTDEKSATPAATPSTGHDYEDTLIVSNLHTEEAVRSIFPDQDRTNIQFIEPYRKSKYLVHFNTEQEARAALYRQPPHYKYKKNEKSIAGQPRQPFIRVFTSNPDEENNQASPRSRVSQIDGLSVGQASDGFQASQSLTKTESVNFVAKHQSPPAPAVAAPSQAESLSNRSKHQNALLSLLKTPAASMPSSNKVTRSTLEAPTPSFELSAIPSPDHSKEQPGATEPQGAQPSGDSRRTLPMSQPTAKRGKASLAPRRSPVSATVDGPLNVPQFDLLSQNRKPSPKLAAESHKLEPPRKSPITILARPSRVQVESQSVGQNGLPIAQQSIATSATQPETPTSTARKESQIPMQTQPNAGFLPRPLTISPTNKKPPTVQTPKNTQPATKTEPTILRPPHIRPQAQDSIFSPIEPLPSPQHKLAFDRRGQQTKEQKQSLLSLFSDNSDKPTPPPLAAGTSTAAMAPSQIATGSPIARISSTSIMAPPPPPSRVDSTASALVSPPAVGTFQERNNIATAQGGLIRRATGKGDKVESASSGRQTPRPPTPKDTKKFLLGYLDSVVSGGK